MSDLQRHYLSRASDGQITRFNCRYCHAELAPKDREWREFMGHAKDCDAILAGIAVEAKPIVYTRPEGVAGDIYDLIKEHFEKNLFWGNL
jgi:hypothetical protein